MAAPWTIATLDQLKVYRPPLAATSANDEGLTACLAAATGLIQGRTRRILQRAQITEWFNGADAHGKNGEVLHLSKAYAPIDLTASITVTEDGTTLTVASTYDASADAIVDPGPTNMIPGLVRLIRQNVAPVAAVGYSGVLLLPRWSSGYRNISVQWTGGYADGSLPAPLVQACCDIAWRLWQEGGQTSTASRSGGSTSRSVVREFPKWIESILDQWTIR